MEPKVSKFAVILAIGVVASLGLGMFNSWAILKGETLDAEMWKLQAEDNVKTVQAFGVLVEMVKKMPNSPLK